MFKTLVTAAWWLGFLDLMLGLLLIFPVAWCSKRQHPELDWCDHILGALIAATPVVFLAGGFFGMLTASWGWYTFAGTFVIMPMALASLVVAIVIAATWFKTA